MLLLRLESGKACRTSGRGSRRKGCPYVGRRRGRGRGRSGIFRDVISMEVGSRIEEGGAIKGRGGGEEDILESTVKESQVGGRVRSPIFKKVPGSEGVVSRCSIKETW